MKAKRGLAHEAHFQEKKKKKKECGERFVTWCCYHLSLLLLDASFNADSDVGTERLNNTDNALCDMLFSPAHLCTRI